MSMNKKSMAGPPPYTITCEPQPYENPGFSGDTSALPGPANMGWNAPSQLPPQYPGNPQPQPYPPSHQPVAVHSMQPGVHTANLGSASVVYVAHHQQPQVVISGLMPKHSTAVTCPSCRNTTNTNVVHKANTRTHMWAFCLCIWGFWVCCLCAAPYCMNSCKNSEHYCSNCGAYIGVAP